MDFGCAVLIVSVTVVLLFLWGLNLYYRSQWESTVDQVEKRDSRIRDLERSIEEFSKELDLREMKIRELYSEVLKLRSGWQTSRGDYVKIREINQGYYEKLQAQKSAADRAFEILRSGFQDNITPARWNGGIIRGVSELFVRGY